ncbi:Clavaminate synthase-like protein [Phlegmacium glaucopus]|nr:Clavaminate synthase-like protein [Phlegmacium glaucopus]
MSFRDRLPIIDIVPLLNSDPKNTEQRVTTAKALHSACIEYGFFYLNIEAYVDPSEPEELALLGKQFFSLPQAEKDQLSLKNQDYARGYAKLKENVTNGKADNHEGLDFYKPVKNPDKTKPIWGENQWPSIPGFRNKFNRWAEKMTALGLILMEAIAEGLGMTKEEWRELRNQVDDSFWVMRVIGYPPLPNDHDGLSCGAHRDYGCLTFLYADPTPSALQVFLNRPGESQSDITGLPSEQGLDQGIWIDADPIPGCVVCNIGEMWEIWTNGLYRSTLHRVVHRGSNYRIPFFFEPNFDAVVKPLAVVSRLKGKEPSENTDANALRRPVVYGDFLVSKVGNNFDSKSAGKGKYD